MSWHGDTALGSTRLDIRIGVNPNAYHGNDDPQVYIARFRDANALPELRDEVTVVQDEDDPDEPDYISTAEVLAIDHQNQLIVMRVDWKGFHDALPTPEQALHKLRTSFPTPYRVDLQTTA